MVCFCFLFGCLVFCLAVCCFILLWSLFCLVDFFGGFLFVFFRGACHWAWGWVFFGFIFFWRLFCLADLFVIRLIWIVVQCTVCSIDVHCCASDIGHYSCISLHQIPVFV